MTLVAGCAAVFAAMSPLVAVAEDDRACPSGVVIELGGVSNHARGRGHRCHGDDVSFASVGHDSDDDLSIASVGDARPLVLPDTGGGPPMEDDQNTLLPLAIFASVILVGTGGYLGIRRVKARQ